jgi:hypothetical protein
MTLSAKDFWKKTPLTAVEALATNLNNLIEENEDLLDMYIEDLNDVETAIHLFRADDPETLVDFVWNLDTSPREDLIVAFVQDCGEIFVKEHFGVELA